MRGSKGPLLWIFSDPEALSRAAATLFARRARQAIRRSGRFAVALSGGQTPRQAYEWLARSPCRDAVEWDRVHVFWGDERCVPFEDPRNNARMAFEALLNHVPIPQDQIHPIACADDPKAAAARYERILRDFFGERPARFDLVFLGLGEDGHTASLFPFSPALEEQVRWVVAVEEATPPRVTLTFPLLNQARLVAFLVSGANKAGILREVLRSPPNLRQRPAQGIRPIGGRVLWLVDRAAGSLL
ncbi:MAG TPA: 6-phosphogluconolactonase [Thermoflexus sp.]|nr:6-phosphogluconolactonase [Thermoflexus sp.]